MAREDEGCLFGVHCNRKIGPTMEFGCRPCKKVTVFRIGRKPGGTFRFFIAAGEALDMGKQYFGTSVVVKTVRNAKEIITKSVEAGWEPHFAVIYADVSAELKNLAKLIGLEMSEYL